MTRDLALPIEIVGAPLVRDHDGLALSSRNAFLSPAQRQRALSLNRSLAAMAAQARAGERDVTALIKVGRGALDVDELDYLEVLDEENLTPLTVLDRPARAFVAAKLGTTRLIDNWVLPV
jgi:pantoate--beta-alanine ligase